MSLATAEELHRFWFDGCLDDPAAAGKRSAMWFGSSRELDERIRTQFEPTIHAAARGELASWESAASSAVSLVIVLDQFPRNVYRNTAQAFAFDERALSVTRRAIAAGHLGQLSVPERAFLLMPYQHVEDLAMQREGVALFAQLCADAPAAWRGFADNTLEFARKHLTIIERFGRFPYRNRVLGRSSTAAEEEYLASKPETFGQGGS